MLAKITLRLLIGLLLILLLTSPLWISYQGTTESDLTLKIGKRLIGGSCGLNLFAVDKPLPPKPEI